MSEDNGDQNDILEGMFGTGVYEAPRPAKKEFLPWHRPRKQFVRDRQWCEQINRLLVDRQEGEALRYLGLPGTDLLDLRHFHAAVCEPNDIELRFLGFNSDARPGSSNQTEMNISLDEVKRLGRIDPLSEVIPDDFCAVADEQSIAWKKTRGHGPFDIVNLDLCDGFGKHPPGEIGNSHYNALNRIMALQSRRNSAWLLFLTTRTGKNDIHADVLKRLIEMYLTNLAKCDEFREASVAVLGVENEGQLESKIETPEGHLEIFLVGLCKWIIGLATTQNPPSKVEIKSTIGYRVASVAEHDDLVSIALRFEPTCALTADPIGLAVPSDAPILECGLAGEAIRRLNKRCSADSILGSDNDLRSTMEAETSGLLVAARYDAAAYSAWLRTQE